MQPGHESGFGLDTSVLDCAPHGCLDEAGQAFTLVEHAFCGGAEFGLDANWRKGRRLHFRSIALAMQVCIIKVPCQGGSGGDRGVYDFFQTAGFAALFLSVSR